MIPQVPPPIVLLAAVSLLASGAHAQDAVSTPPAQPQGATPGAPATPGASPAPEAPATPAAPAAKAPATALSRDSQSALRKLHAQVPAARTLGEQATAVLVFPKIRKAGFVVGGQYGEGTLFKGGKPVAYYSTTGLSYGLQAGAQQFGYALFFMNDDAVGQLDKADGFEVGAGPSVVVVDQGMAKNLTTTTMNGDIYAFVFGQKGLMAGAGLQGNKVKRIAAK